MQPFRRATTVTTILLSSLAFSASVTAQEPLKPEIRSSIVLQESFDDNSNGWDVWDRDTERLAIEQGAYHIENRTEYVTVPMIELNLPAENDNFSIETLLTHVSGMQNYRYGLAWGADNTESIFAFLVASNGHFQFAKVTPSEWIRIKIWEKHPGIYQSGTPNKLTLVKKSTRITFFINGQLVHEDKFRGLSYNRIGFLVANKQTIKADYLTITKIPEAIASAQEEPDSVAAVDGPSWGSGPPEEYGLKYMFSLFYPQSGDSIACFYDKDKYWLWTGSWKKYLKVVEGAFLEFDRADPDTPIARYERDKGEFGLYAVIVLDNKQPKWPGIVTDLVSIEKKPWYIVWR